MLKIIGFKEKELIGNGVYMGSDKCIGFDV